MYVCICRLKEDYSGSLICDEYFTKLSFRKSYIEGNWSSVFRGIVFTVRVSKVEYIFSPPFKEYANINLRTPRFLTQLTIY